MWVAGEQGNKGNFFRGTGEQRPKNKGNRGTQAILENREHTKSRVCCWGTRERGHLFEGNKGTGTPAPLGRHLHSSSLIRRIGQCDSFKYFSQSKFKLFLCEPVC